MEALVVFYSLIRIRGEVKITIEVPFNRDLVERFKSMGGRYSILKSAWIFAKSKENKIALKKILQGYTWKPSKRIRMEPSAVLSALSVEDKAKVQKFGEWMRTRRYSENTIKVYVDSMSTFIRFFQGKSVHDLDNSDINRFNSEYIIANNFSSSYQNQMVNAIKAFFLQVDKKRMVIEDLERPRLAKRLPQILSKEEIKILLKSPRNLKHRALLSLIYSCGLRCGEVLNLKPMDIDPARHTLHIRNGKGNKDRIVPLSEKTIVLMREYYEIFRPKVYLFEGQREGFPYDSRSLQNVLKAAMERAGIRKQITLHSLRHSYATHLLEAGTNLRLIQEILGHKSSKTTEIYTHVSVRSIENIRSPFDDL